MITNLCYEVMDGPEIPPRNGTNVAVTLTIDHITERNWIHP